MRAIFKTLTGVGCVAAALLMAAPAHGQMSGGTGSFSGGGGGGGATGGGGGDTSGGGGSGGSSANNGNFQLSSANLADTVGSTPSTLNSFNNVGTGTSTNGIVSPSNPLAAYYYNPLSQGLITISSSGAATPSSVAFGSPLYANLMSGSSSSGGRGSSSAFGGSANSGSLGSFGGTSASSSSRTGSLNGTASVSSSSTIKAILYTGATTWGPALGRRGVVIGGPVKMAGVRAIPLANRQRELQAIIARSSHLSAPAAIRVTTNGNTVVLTGTVASEDEGRIAENVLRTHPGVSSIQNNLTVKAGNP